jgi:tetratricopeptide (TPR) repeat protein
VANSENKPNPILTSLALILLTLVTFWTALHCQFVDYDDNDYVTRNPHIQSGITAQSVAWAMTARYVGNWHPLTWMSHMLDYELFGLNPEGHHATSLLLHALNVVLLFLVLRKMTGAHWRSAFVAALFAVHPLHVESVAWVAERKDVLSTFFGLLAIAAYLRYTEKPKLTRYLPVALLFALSLMSKAMLVTLPFVLLLLDFWPLKRIALSRTSISSPESNTDDFRNQLLRLGRLILEKVPLLALSCISSLLTVSAQGFAVGQLKLPFYVRLANAVLSYFRYIAKMLWPTKLVVLYPFPSGVLWPVIIASIAILGFTLLVFRFRSNYPWLFTGWFWYLGTLIPVIGLVQVGMQSIADRYTYVPSIGLFVILAWGGFALADRWRIDPVSLGVLSLIPIAICAGITRHQLTHWKDSTALFEHTLRWTSGNAIIENNLAAVYLARGEVDAAAEHAAAAVKISPENTDALSNLGSALLSKGKVDESIACYRRALQIHPNDFDLHHDLGCALVKKGDWNAAIDELQAAVRLNPTVVTFHSDLARALLTNGKLEEGAQELQKILQIDPNHWESHYYLGQISMGQGKLDEAARHFTDAIHINSTNALLHFRLGLAWNLLNKNEAAAQEYQQSLDRDPHNIEALNNLAWLRASSSNPKLRNGKDAVRLAEEACRLDQTHDPRYISTLAAAYAADDQFEKAIQVVSQAATIATAAGNLDFAHECERRAELFRSQKAIYDGEKPN